MDDHELLREYVGNRSQDAFRELVNRHVAMVYSAARRMVGDAHLAEEVAQNVFTTLARKADTVTPPQIVGGWLYNTTRHLSMHSVRSEQRRREREQTAAAMQSLETSSDAERIADQIEPAMSELEAGERDVLILRYLENRSLREVGAELGISEDAARMRANRALEQLRAVLHRQGVGITSVLLASALAGSTASAVPVGLTAAIMSAAIAGSAAVAASTHTVISTMNWINLKSVSAIVAAVAVAGTGSYLVQQKRVEELRGEQEKLLAEQTKLQTERDTAVAAAEFSKAELDRTRKDAGDLLRLRSEVGVLRQQLAAAEQQQAARGSRAAAPRNGTAAPRPGDFVAKAQFANRGYATPEEALQTVAWATMSGTSNEQINEGLSQELLEDPDAMKIFQRNTKEAAPVMKGMQFVAKKVLSDDRVEIKVRVETLVNGMEGVTIVPMTRVGGSWKVANGIRDYAEEWDKSGQIQTFTH